MNDANYFTTTLIPEKTEVLYDPDEIVKRVVDQCNAIKYTMDVCIDADGPSMLVIPNHPVTLSIMDMKKRGVRSRFISEITKDNLSYCQELTKIGEIRHLDEIKGNFGIADRKLYHASATTNESEPPPQLIVSTVRAFVDQQQYFFDMLWKKAIPAKQRIKEIEQGLKREFMETIQDPYETQKICKTLLSSADEEILIMLATHTKMNNTSLDYYEQKYLFPLLKNATERGVKIRLLIDQSTIESIERQRLKVGNSNQTEIQILDMQHQNKILTLIVDTELCLTVEVKTHEDYDENDSPVEVLGLATYSNSESTVSSYASIFDTLWIQAELRSKRKKISVC